MVTVVDAASLARDYGSHDLLRDRGETAGEGDGRALVDLIVEQVEFADVVVLNKVSGLGEDALRSVRGIVAALNADARVVETDFGRVDTARVLDTGLFDEDRAATHPLWFKELHGSAEHQPETLEYGIASFVYRARRPFVPERFAAFLARSWPGMIRAKGHFWLATRPAWAAEMSLAGGLVRTGGLGRWWCEAPRERWPDDEASLRGVEALWHSVWGDRRQELVFIGQDLDEAAIRDALDGCLVAPPTDGRFDPARYRSLHDPFAAWGSEAGGADHA